MNKKQHSFKNEPLPSLSEAETLRQILKYFNKNSNKSIQEIAQSHEAANSLEYWSRIGNLDGVKAVLDRGDNINAQNEQGATALHAAAAGGHLEIARLLVEKGADLKAQTSAGETPLQIAQRYHQAAIADYLHDVEA